MEKFLKKNIYTLYMCVCVCVCIYICGCLVAQSCLTLCDPLDYSPPGSSLCMRISQARILEQVAFFLLQEIFLTQGSNPPLLYLLCCRWSLYPLSHLGSLLCTQCVLTKWLLD